MNTSNERRAIIIDQLADHVLAEGVASASLRRLAEAAHVSDRMLQYYFSDKAKIMDATLERVSERLIALLNARTAPSAMSHDRLLAELSNVALADDLLPYMRLWLEVAALSARNDPVYRDVAERIARSFLAWGASQLDRATAHEREADAARLFVMIKGLVLLKCLGLGDVCETVTWARPAQIPERKAS